MQALRLWSRPLLDMVHTKQEDSDQSIVEWRGHQMTDCLYEKRPCPAHHPLQPAEAPRGDVGFLVLVFINSSGRRGRVNGWYIRRGTRTDGNSSGCRENCDMIFVVPLRSIPVDDANIEYLGQRSVRLLVQYLDCAAALEDDSGGEAGNFLLVLGVDVCKDGVLALLYPSG